MTTFCTTPTCPVPVDSTTLCNEHHTKLVAALKEVPGYVEELATTTTKVVAYDSRRGPRSPSRERPMPLNIKASETGRNYADTLTSWARQAADQVGEPVIHPRPEAAAGYIRTHLQSGRLNGWDEAGRFLDWLLGQEQIILRIIDRPAPRWYAGPCPSLTWNEQARAITECGADLHANTASGIVRCKNCGTEHDIDDRRDFLIARLDDQIATVPDLVEAIQRFTNDTRKEDTLLNLIYQWNRRNRIIPVRHIVRGTKRHPLFRIGDVLALLKAADTNQTNDARKGA